MADTKTPRTDAVRDLLLSRGEDLRGHDITELWELSRQLERDNADLRALNAVNESGCENALARYKAAGKVIGALTAQNADLAAKLAEAQADAVRGMVTHGEIALPCTITYDLPKKRAKK